MKSKLILCTDWQRLLAELRRQLKPHGLSIKSKTRRLDDQITVEVVKTTKRDHPAWP